MTKYTTTDTITVPPGTKLKLTPAQAGDRGRALRKIEGEDGCFEAIEPLQFKAGEQLGIEGDLGRATMAKLDPVTDEEAPSAPSAGDGTGPASVASRKAKGARAAADGQ